MEEHLSAKPDHDTKKRGLFWRPRRNGKTGFRIFGVIGVGLSEFPRFQEGRYPEMDITTRGKLKNCFEVHNERLYEYLNLDLGWEK